MRILKKFSVFIFIIVLNVSCGGGNGNFIVPSNRTAEDVKNDFSNLDIQPGINDFTLESTVAGFYWNFRIIAPENASESNKRPLIIDLHGGASNVYADAHKVTNSCLAQPAFADLNAYIISPNSNGYFWFDQENQVQVLALLDLAETYLPIDENKVVITGYSDGGNGSWFYADYYSDLFSAAIPMASSYNPAKSNGDVLKINIPLYVIHGGDDELFPVAQTEEWVNQSIEAGSDITFVIADGLTHFEPCEYIDYLKDASVWLQTDVWN